MKTGVIYSIRLKGTEKAFYVGQTRHANPETRWRQHMKGRTSVAKALQLFGCMDDFEFTVIERIPETLLNEREEYWISTLGTLHPNGLNMNRGGSGAGVAQRVRKKMAEAAARRVTDPAYRAKMRAAVWGNVEHQERVLRAARERNKSPEFIAKLSAKIAATWADPKVRERRLAACRKPEVRAKISISSSLRKHSAESRAKISEANRGRKHSEETKEKIAASVRRTKAMRREERTCL